MNKKTHTPRARRKYKFHISPLYLCMAAVFFLTGGGYEFAVYTAAMGLHEMAHAEVSQRLGYSLISFKLMPYGASLTGSYEGVKYRDELAIAAAGPLLNLILTVPSVALWWLIPQTYFITQAFVTANLMIAVFNVLPVFPLDGGRILLAVLSQKMPRNLAYKRVRIIGFIFAAIFMGLFTLSIFYKFNITFAAAGLFILLSTLIPDKNSYYQRLYSMAYRTEKIRRGLTVKEIIVDADSTVLKLTKLLNGNYFTRFTVVGADLKPIFSITETELEALSTKAKPNENIVKAWKK